MKEIKKLLIVIFFLSFVVSAYAQTDYEKYKHKMQSKYESFRKKTKDEYESYRKKVNKEYSAFIEKTWKKYNSFAGRSFPDENIKPVPPQIVPEEDRNKPKPDPKPLPFDDIEALPQPEPQPEPIVPIEDKPIIEDKSKKDQTIIKQKTQPKNIPTVSFTYFGTTDLVRFDIQQAVHIQGTDEKNIARAWKNMSTDNYSLLVFDCLEIRKKRCLSDWGYLQMLYYMSEFIMGKNTNDAILLMSYVYCQSGYKMRLGRRGNQLLMLYASKHTIYNKVYFSVGDDSFYPFGNETDQIMMCDAAFPNEKPMSLYISTEQKFAEKTSNIKTRSSKRYPELKTSIASNNNLMQFYETYPSSIISPNFITRWAMYANTPMSESIKDQIYPDLRKAINNCNELTAVNKLLNYVQTGFEYEYDYKVWGHDRAFFAEESLYYPYCDCEDRSILFTRLVRDLLKLDCILIYYPGHLASAVCFSDGLPKGDYIQLDNRKFTICDPTYINANVGMTMKGMDNQTAKVILLNK